MVSVEQLEYVAFLKQMDGKFAHLFLTGLAWTRWHKWVKEIVWC